MGDRYHMLGCRKIQPTMRLNNDHSIFERLLGHALGSKTDSDTGDSENGCCDDPGSTDSINDYCRLNDV